MSNNRYLPNQSIVLQGSEIFNLFFEGTKGDDIDDRGQLVSKNLQSEWSKLDSYFNHALSDITETTNDRIKSQLENWFEVLKKVMRMWEGTNIVSENQKTKLTTNGMKSMAAAANSHSSNALS